MQSQQIQYSPYQLVSHRIQDRKRTQKVSPTQENLSSSFERYKETASPLNENLFYSELRNYLIAAMKKLEVADSDQDDIVQITTIDVLRGLKSFRGSASINTWVFRILARNVQRHKLASRRFQTVPFEEADYPIEMDFKTDYSKLTPREIAVVRAIESGYSYSEIAKAQGSTEDAIKAVMKRLRKRFTKPVNRLSKTGRKREWYEGDVAEIVFAFNASGTMAPQHEFNSELNASIKRWLESEVVCDDEVQDPILIFQYLCDKIQGNDYLSSRPLQWFMESRAAENVLAGTYDPFPAVPVALNEAVGMWNALADELSLPRANTPHKTWNRDPYWRVMAGWLGCELNSDPDREPSLEDFAYALDQIREQYREGRVSFNGWTYTLPWLFNTHGEDLGVNLVMDGYFTGKKQPQKADVV